MSVERSRLVERLHRHLEEHGWPRVVLFVIVALSGLAGFMVSFALLGAGMSSMAWRYGLAGGTAYLAFLCLLGVYLVWKRRLGDFEPSDAVNAADLIDLPLPRGGGGSAPTYFSGGRSGGGGASSAWEGRGSGGGGSSWLDHADVGWLVVALAALLAGLLAVGYVIWVAPALLAEVFVDALIVSTVSHRLTRSERRDWTATVVRRTWLPACLMVATLVVGGWALQQAAPDAKSIGPAVRALTGR